MKPTYSVNPAHPYLVAFGTDHDGTVEITTVVKNGKTDCFGVCRSAESLEAALAIREASGDLVFDARTREIVQDTSWLSPAELGDPSGYPQKKIQQRVRLVIEQL